MVTRARLRRRTENRLVAGVAGGVADALNAPVAVVRIVVFLIVTWTPWAIWLYALAAAVLPPRGRDRPGWDNVVALGRLALAFGVPVVTLFGLGALNEPFRGPAGWWIALYGLAAAGGAALLGADYWRGRPRTDEEARATVLGALPAAAAAALLAAAVVLVPDVRWERAVPAVPVVGAVALLVAARRGNPRPFVAPAVLALAAAALVAGSDMRLDGGVGNTTVEASGGRFEVRRAFGDVTVDLRRAVRSGADVELDASVGFGDLKLLVSPYTPVELVARVGKGRIDDYSLNVPDGDGSHGFDQRLTGRFTGHRGGRKTRPVRVVAGVGVGAILAEHREGLASARAAR